MPPGAPIPERERLDVLDALRGFALVGILAANLLVFTGVIFLDPTARAAMPYPGLDTLVSWLQVVLIEGKFYGLFSLLFGIGAAMFIGRPGAPRMVSVASAVACWCWSGSGWCIR
jgi:uncharacterized protein